jgi:hypothetical protein
MTLITMESTTQTSKPARVERVKSTVTIAYGNARITLDVAEARRLRDALAEVVAD